MSTRRHYITTTIPYVNARPHPGFALELVQADTLARHRRLRGDRVRLLTGTDDNTDGQSADRIALGVVPPEQPRRMAQRRRQGRRAGRPRQRPDRQAPAPP
ncbi:class I tRNA ligase family protein [Streptomyces sp. NPDC048324]|uniref:class I tRNA ligase family protein n=1 Tax=Streptomyces sp. NPDC048324 TaxID=3157205 RepID=UPI00342AE220